ncbi:S9 family peptidase [Sulfurisphaera ohwakuensis]|uniref:Dipeptidyl aminopeptidase/acylaminoacyl peptidase n=1 Tax=Sulfurisphaera ohwakuensis TaxID=69656 RepID=A0A650CF83_SULOH|nr:S9 family peptidase [Sulfurisphaera ohwakuensis]MBB5254332.1 dipeptidyl aminopeptidase/acylaminoacyl peptidase [Sulfurisphaera ohwakuensis]QGR16429.1 prolyl oligopeptidase family serine peptidase [Sulfurisphaera ohwakuensis]
MTPEEAYSIRLISDVKLNEIGLFHVETWIENEKYKSAIYLNKQRITFGGNESSPYYYDGFLYYVKGSRREAKLIRQRPYGEPEEILSLGKIHKYVFHKNGILIIGEEKVKPSTYFVSDKLKYRFDGKGLFWTRQSLFLYNKELRKIISGNFDVTDIATNGNRIIISATRENDDYGLADIYEVDINTGELTRITQGEGNITAIAMNRDGKIAYLGHRKGKTPWAVREIIFPEEGKSFLCGNTCGNTVLSDLFDGVKEKIVYEGDQVITLGQVGGESHIYSVSDKVTKLTEGKLAVRGFDFKDGKLAYFYSTPEKPVILFYNGEAYDPNPNVKGLSPIEVKGEIEGWALITNPSNPTILFIHGGPHMAYGYAYFIEFQFFASNGYNIIYANPSGSQGYGEEFAKACVGDWGGRDMKELINFVNEVKKKFNLTGKFGVTGGSYGGYMTNWIITQTDIFSAAISERSISNLVSMCGTSDIGFWFNAIEAGIDDPWSKDGIEKLMKMSPIYYVKNVKTPTMLIHGEVDYRCPIEQVEQFFIALKMNNIPTELVRYQGDGHEHARKGNPKNMIDRLKRKLGWFDKYLKS